MPQASSELTLHPSTAQEISVAAQNAHALASGAYTGEVS